MGRCLKRLDRIQHNFLFLAIIFFLELIGLTTLFLIRIYFISSMSLVWRSDASCTYDVTFVHKVQANKDTIRRELFRRAVLAFNEHVDRCKAADPFCATPASFKASARKYVRSHAV